MTDRSLIEQIEQALAGLKAGDESAIEHLAAIIGEVVGGDKITVGDIAQSTVAIGRHIEMTIREGGLPERVVAELSRLMEELRAFMRRGWESYTGERRLVRLFLSSPSDVAEERSLAFKTIERLNKNPYMPFRIEAFLWEQANMALFTHCPPQTNIDNRIKPADCDVVVVILWSRVGTPLPSDKVKPEAYRFPLGPGDTLDPSRYLSGTEYEFVNAMQGAEAHGRPLVLVYRRDEEPIIGGRDPERGVLEAYPGIRLPTEWEWQWAASGEGQELDHPFGEWDGAKANTRGSGLSRTTAVGMYPAGAAPCGALDMSGNVWE